MNFRYKTEEKCQNIKSEFENGKSEVFVNPNAMVFPDEKTYPSLVFLNSEKGKMLFEENKGKWDVIEKIIGGKATAFLIKVLKR